MNIFIIAILLITSLIKCSENCNRPEKANDLLYPQEKEYADVIRCISYNVRGESRIDRERGNSWDLRKYKIQQLITYYQPHIIGFQEVSSSYIVDLEQLFPQYQIIAFDISERDKDVALLIDKNRFVCQKIDYFWLAQNPFDKESGAWDSRATRIVVYAQLLDQKTNKELFTFCTHFDSSGMQAQLESALVLNKQQQMIAQDFPTIILGDFNLFTPKTNEVYALLINRMKDIRTLTQEHYGPDGTWIGWTYDNAAMPLGSIGKRLDHILIHNGQVSKEGVLNIKIDNDMVINATDPSFLQLSYPSDHLPIIADIAL